MKGNIGIKNTYKKLNTYAISGNNDISKISDNKQILISL